MQIIIPMSGIGQRFLDAGYTTPKPLIEIDGKPIIEHVTNLFPEETNFIFICNRDHLKKTPMKSILKRIAPQSMIVEIPPHKKGPVYAVQLISGLINENDEAIINYCDFSTFWDYQDFLKHTRNRVADGAIPAYKNFHPHMLGSTNYAFMRDNNQWMLEIKEKEPFTENRTSEYASNGTYYFKRGEYVKKYFKILMDRDINLKGECYVSLIYNLMVEDRLKVSIYEIQHMLQWGTPEDIQIYNSWSNYFRQVCNFTPDRCKKEPGLNLLISMAGVGSRFVNEGYEDPKPLLDVSGFPMVLQATRYLPTSDKQTFVALAEHLNNYPIESKIKGFYPDAIIIPLSRITEGQACTTEIGVRAINPNEPLLIAACDNGMLWDPQKFQDLIEDSSIDAIVWTFVGHPSARQNPHMYGWVRTEADNALGVSVKKPLSDAPGNDHAIVGTFYFRKAQYFVDAYQQLIKKNVRINNEFYIDSMIGELVALNYITKVFKIDHYICWGTPNDYQTFMYWQSFFDKCDWHPYSLENDPLVNPEKIDELKIKYRTFSQENT